VFTIRDAPSESRAKLFRVDREKITGTRDIRVANLLPVRVVSVVDGDTVKVQIDGSHPSTLKSRETIRLLGIDAPESRPPRPKGYFGQEASNYVKGALTGRLVYLAFDWDLRDVYGRLLAYIYLADGDCFNLDLVRRGYAYAYIKYRFAFMDEFTQTEAGARKEKMGLWAHLPLKKK
jgi:micrococcal nuclease